MNNPIKDMIEKTVRETAGDAAAEAVRSALAELDGDKIVLSVGPVIIPSFTIPEFTFPIAIDTIRG